MKKEEIMKNVSTTFSKVSVKLKKHSPEILVVAGVVGTVASAVMACHATTKLDSVLEKSKKDIDAIHKCAENEELAAEYSKDDAKKDLTIVYVRACEAEDVLERMDELIATYQVVSVADFYDLVGVSGNYTDNKYGWTDIRNASVIRVRDGYMIKLPKALPLN